MCWRGGIEAWGGPASAEGPGPSLSRCTRLREPPNVLTACAPNVVPRSYLLSWLRGPLSPVVEPTPAAAAAPRIAGQGNGRAGPSSEGTAGPSSAAGMSGPSSAGMGRTGREPLPAAAAPDMSMLDTLDHRQLAEMQVRIAKMLATGATPAR